jgi:hypothetical protein
MEPTRYSYSYRQQSSWTRTLILLSLLQALLSISEPTAIVVGAKQLVSASPHNIHPLRFSSGRSTADGVIYRVRGGAGSESSEKKKKNRTAASAPIKRKKKTASGSASKDKKKKKKASSTGTDAQTNKNKKGIGKALKERDAAQVLGDAIRDRAEQLCGRVHYLNASTSLWLR